MEIFDYKFDIPETATIDITIIEFMITSYIRYVFTGDNEELIIGYRNLVIYLDDCGYADKHNVIKYTSNYFSRREVIFNLLYELEDFTAYTFGIPFTLNTLEDFDIFKHGKNTIRFLYRNI